MLEGRDPPERMMLAIPGRHAVGRKYIDRNQIVVDAFRRERQLHDADIGAVVGAEEAWLAHRPLQAAIAFCRFSSILSRKPVVDSQGWSGPISSARSLVM